jgi:putative ABC transport system permease protein
VFAALIGLYPSRFRAEFGAGMLTTFDTEQARVAGSRGSLGQFAWTVTNLAAAAGGLVVERLRGQQTLLPAAFSHSHGDSMLVTTLSSIRLGLRSLRLAPGFTAAAVMTLALGIGLTTSIFSVVQAVLLRPLPYAAPDRLVAMNSTLQDQSWWSASLADVLEWRELSQTLDSVAFGTTSALAVEAGELPEQVPGVRVSANWFDTLGVEPAVGRTFVAGEDSPNSDNVAVLSHGYWSTRMAGDPDVVGRTFRIDGTETTVVGVAPDTYRADFWGNPQIYVTRRFTVDDAAERVRIYTAVARVRSGVAVAAAQADADRVSSIVAARFPAAMEGWGVELQPLHAAVTGGQRDLLGVLLAAVGLVLLVACANVSNLVLARGTRQRADLAVRTALGASRGRLIGQMLTETMLLAVAGGGLGLLLSAWGTSFLLAQAPAGIPRIDEAGVDPIVLTFTALVCLLTGAAFGVLPALRASRTRVAAVIRVDDTRTGTGGSRGFGARDLLVTAEVAVVVVLLVGAGITVRSFQSLQEVDMGFEQARRLVVPVTLPTQFDYNEIDGIATFFEELRTRLAESPGVAGVATVSIPPLYGGDGLTGMHIIEGRDYEPGAEPTGGLELVSPEYFELMGMAILAGRPLTDLDLSDTRPVAVINDTMARLYWGDRDPIGAKIRLGPEAGGPIVSRWIEIVGVVAGVRYGPEREVRPRLYVPDAQMPAPMNFRAVIVAPRAGSAHDLAPLVQETVAAISPGRPIGTPRSFVNLADAAVSTRRLQSLLLLSFGLVALTLGAVGVYGVVAYGVTQRMREMGIRMALGAGRRDVLRLVLRAAMAPVVVGIALGLLGALALAGLLVALLPGARGADATVLTLVPATLLLTALIASWVPARRATRVDPVSSLRT